MLIIQSIRRTHFFCSLSLRMSFPDHNIASPPSLRTPQKYCDLTGLPTSYEDPKTRLRYMLICHWLCWQIANRIFVFPDFILRTRFNWFEHWTSTQSTNTWQWETPTRHWNSKAKRTKKWYSFIFYVFSSGPRRDSRLAPFLAGSELVAAVRLSPSASSTTMMAQWVLSCGRKKGWRRRRGRRADLIFGKVRMLQRVSRRNTARRTNQSVIIRRDAVIVRV